MVTNDDLVVLREYLMAWDAWVGQGAPVDEPFHRDAGLCWNAHEWSKAQYASKPLGKDDSHRVHKALEHMLVRDFGANSDTPFNPLGETGLTYGDERGLGVCWQNTSRQQWVSKMLDELPMREVKKWTR